MAFKISASVGSYESGASNQTADIKTVQTLLTDVAIKQGDSSMDPGGIDGKISRTASSSGTVRAIGNFQSMHTGISSPDFRIDVNGTTWNSLLTLADPTENIMPDPVQQPVVGMITLTVEHGGKIPTNTNGVTSTVSEMYESTFMLSGALSGTFKGSIYPDDMIVKGRVVDGSYPLHIGFHKGGTAAKQGASDLIFKDQGIRAGLLVNARSGVPVYSKTASKTTSYGINVHNGFYGGRGSDGCLTLQPTDWRRFIEKILGAYPNIADWHSIGTNTGKKIGTLVVKS